MSIKKIIAKEGLILLGIIFLGIFLIFISSRFPSISEQEAKKATAFEVEMNKMMSKVIEMSEKSIPKEKINKYSEQWRKENFKDAKEWNQVKAKEGMRKSINFLAKIILILGYPLCLFIRFIVWAIMTLKKKEQSA